MKRKGFTLLELIIVVIIIGVLATLGFAQYTRLIERARGAEARAVFGAIRTQAAGIWLERNSGGTTVPASTFNNANLGIGTGADQVPSACRASNYFSYGAAQTTGNNGVIITATRCTASGKSPNASVAGTLNLTSDFAANTDVWAGGATPGGY
jgi:prepilin-type N-terminal cleavage/methylation domain-containing protein